MSIKRVCVLGASADQGIPLVAALQRRGFAVTAGARRPGAMESTPFPDLPVVSADITDGDAMARAFEGFDAAVFHLPFEFDRDIAARNGRAVAEGAKRAGLKKIVFNTSCFIADHDLNLTAHDGRRDMERALEETGIPCVFIEPMVFMDNIYRIWTRPLLMREGVFAYPASPTLKINWVCLDDVAEAMAAALAIDRADGKHVALGGPEALTGDEVAERLSGALDRPITFRSLKPSEFASTMSALVTGSPEVTPGTPYEGMAKFYSWYNAQETSPLTVDPSKAEALLGITMTPLADWAKRQDWSAGLPG